MAEASQKREPKNRQTMGGWQKPSLVSIPEWTTGDRRVARYLVLEQGMESLNRDCLGQEANNVLRELEIEG